MPIQVVLCDDVPELRLLLRCELEEDPEFVVAGEAGDATECVAVVARTQPDVVLLDLSLPEIDGLEAIPLVTDAAPGASIIVCSGFAAAELAAAALEAGADRYLEKGTNIAVVRETIRAAVDARQAR